MRHLLPIVTLLTFSACAGSRTVTMNEMNHPAAPPEVTEANYRVYTGDGQPASIDEVVAAMDTADVVFVGETHDDPVAHAIELLLFEKAFTTYGQARQVAVSLEMFCRDVQYIVDEYTDDVITEQHFLASTSPWRNYETDYRPVVEFAKAHGLPVIASNAPRRYVNRVTRLGPEALDALSARAKASLAPLPYPEPSDAYTAQWYEVMHEAMGGSDGDSTAAHPQVTEGLGNMLEAQALWDATMAYSIAQYLEDHAHGLVVHAVGGFHVEKGTGIPEALRHYRPDVRTVNVAVRPSETFTDFDEEQAGTGDFVILSDASLPRTFAAGR